MLCRICKVVNALLSTLDLTEKDLTFSDTFRQDAFDLKRSLLLDILYFLLKDLAIHKKRAYLSVFLALPDIPPEFAHDDGI